MDCHLTLTSICDICIYPPKLLTSSQRSNTSPFRSISGTGIRHWKSKALAIPTSHTLHLSLKYKTDFKTDFKQLHVNMRLKSTIQDLTEPLMGFELMTVWLQVKTLYQLHHAASRTILT